MLAFAENDKACGMIEMTLRNIVDGCLSSPVGYIEGIVVDPQFRGRGIAASLIRLAETWCRSRGCTEIGTDAEIHELESQKFHERMGFEETYRIVGYRKSL